MKTILFTAAAVATLVAGPAQAATFNLTYTSDNGSFSGTLETTDVADADGYFLVTSLTGTHNGNAAVLLPSNTFPGTIRNDNLFKPTPIYVTGAGISYSAGGANYNLYSIGDAYFDCTGATTGCTAATVDTPVTSITVSAAEAAVPEPATWGLMLAGFGLVGAGLRSRRRSATVSFA